ncbi:hypothetical protein Tco_1308211, partial [Tanacetum coccineum]
MKVEESLNVTFDETPPPPKTSPLEDDDLVKEEAIEINKTRPLGKDLEDKSLESNEIRNINESKSHPLENVIGNLNQRTLRTQAQDKRLPACQGYDVRACQRGLLEGIRVCGVCLWIGLSLPWALNGTSFGLDLDL